MKALVKTSLVIATTTALLSSLGSTAYASTAEEREEQLTNTVKKVADRVELYYVKNAKYPGEVKTTMPEGVRVAYYRVLNPNGGNDSFQVCLRHEDGGYATWDSRSSGAVSNGVDQSCGVPVTDPEERKELTKDDAAGLALQLEGDAATTNGVLPRNKAQFRRQIADKYGYNDQVWIGTYRYIAPTEKAPAGYVICTEHYDGGYAIYKSLKGGVTKSEGEGGC